MRNARWQALLIPVAALVVSGCASEGYYAAAPPPPPPPLYNERPPLIDLALHQGYRTGVDDGARDAYYGRGYRPEHERNFREAPGYDPRLGPYEPYRDAFRDAYLRGYSNGFRRE